jgi:hypothetical protein
MYKTKRINRNNRKHHTYRNKTHPFREHINNYISNEENNEVKLYSKLNEAEYIQSLLSNREFSTTPNRVENHSSVTLDPYTIVLYINMHGAYFDNECINFNDDVYSSLDFFQKISVGQLGCVNIAHSGKKKIDIHMITKSLNKTNTNIDFFDLFRKTYKTFVRNKTPKHRYNTIQNLKKRENTNEYLISHDHHVSYLYDKSQLSNKPLPLLDKTFNTKQFDIDNSNKYEAEMKEKYSYDYFLNLQEKVSELLRTKPKYTNKIVSLSETKQKHIENMLLLFKKEEISIRNILDEDVNSNNLIENMTYIQLLLLLNKYIVIIDFYLTQILRPGIIVLYDGWKNQELNQEKEDKFNIPYYNYLPIKEETFEEEKNMITSINLSELIQMLTKSGYTKIVIHDRSCNSIMFDDKNLCGTVF